MVDLQYVILCHKEHISNKKKDFDCYCEAQGTAFKIKMLILSEYTGVLKCPRIIAFTAVATQEC